MTDINESEATNDEGEMDPLFDIGDPVPEPWDKADNDDDN